jgi:ribosome-associated protein
LSSTLRIAPGVEIPIAEVEIRASRSSGPGGQHANVTESRVEAVFDVAGSATLGEADKARLLEQVGPRVSAVAQDARSQARNRELALERLRERLAAALVVPKERRRTRPKKAAEEKRLADKRARGERKRERRPPETDD